MSIATLTIRELSRGIYNVTLVRPAISFPDEGMLRLTSPQRETLRTYVLDAALGSATAPQRLESLRNLGESLHSLLPAPVQLGLRNLAQPLILRSTDPTLPWELLHDGEEFLGIRAPLCRTLPDLQPLAQPSAREDTMAGLIVANPAGDLDEADREAQELAKLWQGLGIQVKVLRGPQANSWEFLGWLRSGEYHIIHYTGHAGYAEEDEEGYLELADGRFPAAMIVTNLAGSPLVFVNGCESARERQDASPRFQFDADVSSLSAAFLSRGARAFVGTSWPIPDRSGRSFSRLFYQALLVDGLPLGAAMAQARRSCEWAKGDAAWAAYVSYGHPLDRLLPAGQAKPSGRPAGERPAAGIAPQPLVDSVMDEEQGINTRRLGKGALLAFYYAWDERRRTGQPALGTVHLVIGLTRITGGATQRALYRLGASPHQVRDALRRMLASEPGAEEDARGVMVVSMTRRLGRILHLAEVAASEEGSSKIEERHLLLGFVREGGGQTARVLRDSLGTDLVELVREVPHPLFPAGELDEARLDPAAKETLRAAWQLAAAYSPSRLSTLFFFQAMLEREDGLVRAALQAQDHSPGAVARLFRRIHEKSPRAPQRDTGAVRFNVRDCSSRLLGILEIATVAAAKESIPLGEWHLLHGFLTVRGGLTGALLSLLRVDLDAMEAWLEANPAVAERVPSTAEGVFDAEGRLKAGLLDGAALRLCQDGVRQACGLQHASVQIAHLLLASLDQTEGFAADLWRLCVSHPHALQELLRESLRTVPISTEGRLGLDRRSLAPSLQRLLELTDQARAKEGATATTVRHLFQALGQLQPEGAAPLPGELHELLCQVSAVLAPHPLFGSGGQLNEDRLEAEAQGVLGAARLAAREASQGPVTSLSLLAALLIHPGSEAAAAFRELGVVDLGGLAAELKRRSLPQRRPGEAGGTFWQFSFSPHCLCILRLAASIAERERAAQVGHRHLWLGLLSDGQGAAIAFLERKGIALQALLARLRAIHPRSQVQGDADSPLLDSEGHLNLARLDGVAAAILERTVQEALALGDPVISTPYLFASLSRVPGGATAVALQALGQDPRRIRHHLRALMRNQRHTPSGSQAAPSFTARILDILQKADALARREGALIGERQLLAAFLANGGGVTADLLRELGVELAAMTSALEAEDGEVAPAAAMPLLERWGRNLTRLAQGGELDPVIGRELEISQVIEALSQRDAPNPLLVGEAGVGKTAIVEGVAQRLAAGEVPPAIRGRPLVQIGIHDLVRGCELRGQFEERLDQILKEAQAAGAILFLDEAHTLVGAGTAGHGTLDAANILKPALARGRLRCIAATTLADYRQSIELDAALARRFQLIRVEEPDIEETMEILRRTRHLLEEHHNVRIPDRAIRSAIELSDIYVTGQRQPAKARRLLDQASAWLSARCPLGTTPPSAREVWPELDTEAIAYVVARETGIPLTALTAGEAERLRELEVELRRRIVGQDAAIQGVVQAIKQARAGLKDPRRPLGVLLFVGPTGVGKTALARALAACLYGRKERLVRLDMSEFAEPHSVSRLIGSPPGYVGHGDEGQLSGALRQHPYSIVLLDEVEKAHPDVWTLFLQLFDEGRLTDAAGRQVSGRNALFVLTSNVGTTLLDRGRLGFAPAVEAGEEARDRVRLELKRTFPPEFLNRIDRVVLFNHLGPEDVKAIVRLQLGEVESQALARGITLQFGDEAVNLLAQQGYSADCGVRDLARLIDRLVKEPLTELILAGAKGAFVGRAAGGTLHLSAVEDGAAATDL